MGEYTSNSINNSKGIPEKTTLGMPEDILKKFQETTWANINR